MPRQTRLVWTYWNVVHSGLPLQPTDVSGTVWISEQEAEASSRTSLGKENHDSPPCGILTIIGKFSTDSPGRCLFHPKPRVEQQVVFLTKRHVPRCNLATLETPWFKPASKWWERQEEEAGRLANGLQISSPDVAHFWSTPAVISIPAFKVSFPAFFSPVAGIGVKFPLYRKYHALFFFFHCALTCEHTK